MAVAAASAGGSTYWYRHQNQSSEVVAHNLLGGLGVGCLCGTVVRYHDVWFEWLVLSRSFLTVVMRHALAVKLLGLAELCEVFAGWRPVFPSHKPSVAADA